MSLIFPLPRWALLGTTLFAPLAPVAASDADQPSPSEGAAQVEIVDFMRFEPKVLEIEAGTTVTWTNYDGSNHVVQLPDGTESGRMHMESQWSHTFDEPGTYEYGCFMHTHMEGTIIVK